MCIVVSRNSFNDEGYKLQLCQVFIRPTFSAESWRFHALVNKKRNWQREISAAKMIIRRKVEKKKNWQWNFSVTINSCVLIHFPGLGLANQDFSYDGRHGEKSSSNNFVNQSMKKNVFHLWLWFIFSTGPLHWGEEYNTCVGKHQSPINIEEHIVVNVSLPSLKFSGLDVSRSAYLTNNGHTGEEFQCKRMLEIMMQTWNWYVWNFLRSNQDLGTKSSNSEQYSLKPFRQLF